MKSSRHRIYAVTLNWNSYDNVAQCIQNLKTSDQKIEKIVIVDNGSDDGSCKKLASEYKRDDHVRLIENSRNEGFGNAVNKGMELAISEGATHVFLLNNDAIIDKSCLTVLLTSMDGHENVGAASPTVFYKEEPKRIWHGAGYFNYVRANIVVPEKNKMITEPLGQPREVTFLSGCALLLRARMLANIGLFDRDYFFYGEDVEFSLRAIRKGYNLLYVPRAFAWHQIGNIATSRSSPYVLYHRARSSTIFIRKSFPWPYVAYAVFLHVFVYTPYRLWQCRQSARPLNSFRGWIRGSIHGLIFPSRNWVG